MTLKCLFLFRYTRRYFSLFSFINICNLISKVCVFLLGLWRCNVIDNFLLVITICLIGNVYQDWASIAFILIRYDLGFCVLIIRLCLLLIRIWEKELVDDFCDSITPLCENVMSKERILATSIVRATTVRHHGDVVY